MNKIFKHIALKIPQIRNLYNHNLELRDIVLNSNKPDYMPPDNMMSNKKDIIDYAFTRFEISAVAELGCVWGVDGAYGRYIAENHHQTKVTMVDTHWTDRAIELCGKLENIKTITNNFGNPELPATIGNVDAVILFDVLLHQVAPDWDRILQMYAPFTKTFLIVNHQFKGSPITTRLLDLGKEDYLKNVPHDITHPTYNSLFNKMYEMHPEYKNRQWRDVHHVWQWGITDSDLMQKMHMLGFRLAYLRNDAYNTNWDYNSFVFESLPKTVIAASEP